MAEYEIGYINKLLLNEINSSTTNIYSIYGGIRSGKTYLLKSLRCALNNDGYSVLFLSNDDIIFPDDYSVFFRVSMKLVSLVILQKMLFRLLSLLYQRL